jgi:phosphodiesterase/alkaline phosphatase D-like protein
LTPSTEYSWAVRTVQNGLFSVNSNVVTATTADPPPAPMNVTATALTSTRIRVDWSPVAGAKRYLVEQSTDMVNFTQVANKLDPIVTATIINLTPNTTYFYRVRAQDFGNVNGPYSDPPVSATTLP